MTIKQSWLKSLRESAFINQDDLAARLQVEGFDVTRASVSHWETGRHEPPLQDPEFRRALSRALRVNVRTILRLAGYEVDEQQHSVLAERVANLVDQLPTDLQELALRLVEQLARHRTEAV
jgi:transcriptional regulator with XRE-family HTH domain